MHGRDIHGIPHSVWNSHYCSHISGLCTNSYAQSHITDAYQYLWAVVYDSSSWLHNYRLFKQTQSYTCSGKFSIFALKYIVLGNCAP